MRRRPTGANPMGESVTAASGPRRTRKIASFIAALVAFALVLGACGGGGKKGGSDNSSNTTATNPPDTEKPQPGGNLNYGLEAESDGLNPTSNRFAIAGTMMGRAIFDPLFMFDKDGVAQPFLAESVKPSADFKHWTIKLRSGIKFHDGTPLTSEAARVAVESTLADPLVSLAVKNILDIGPDPNKPDPSKAITVNDDLTATLNLQVSDANIPTALTTQLGYIPSPKWIEAAKKDKSLNQCPVGTGPFMMKNCSDRQVGSKTVMYKNPNYWQKDDAGNQLPYLDSITWIVQDDPQTRGKNLDSGTLDIMHTTRDEDIARYRKDDNVRKFEDATGEETYLMMNETKAPFDDIRVRKGLAEATDRETYKELLGSGVLQIADSIFAPGTKWHSDVTNFPKYNPDDAKKLIGEYCTDKPDNCSGGKVKFSYKTTPGQDNDDTYQTVTEFWKDVAIATKTPVEQSQFITDVAVGNYNIVLWRQFGATDPDADTIWIWSKSITPLISINWPRNNDPKIDKLIDDQRATQDFNTRKEIWKKINEQINNDVPYIWLNHTLWDIVANKKVHNINTYKLPDGQVGKDFSNGNHSISQIWIEH